MLEQGLARNIRDGHNMTFTWNGKTETFIVLMPQLNENYYSFWQNFIIDDMLKYGKANFSVDTDRIFLTGLSMGGGGTWAYCGASETNGRQLAAIATSCGACQSTDWCNIAKADLPMWSFHANDDNSAAPVSCTIWKHRQYPQQLQPQSGSYHDHLANGRTWYLGTRIRCDA